MIDVYYSKSMNDTFLDRLKIELENNFRNCKRIAIKMHFGEPGNKTALTPEDIAPIIKIIEGLGIKYYLYDSSVNYGGERANPKTHKAYALKKGFRNVETGDEFVESKGKHLTYQVCKKLVDVDAVLVLTHVKGHECSGFGGGIKNLGMGALTGKSKGDIHTGGKPVFSGECVKCGACVSECPVHGMKLVDTEKYPVVFNCYGCSNCSYICPNNVIKPQLASFDILLSDGANAAQSKFKKHYYVSLLKNITAHCDCYSDAGKIIAKDSGYLMSPDGVAIDQATHDVIVRNNGEVFLTQNFKKGTEHILEAEKLGMGTREYVLKEL